jgi:hypothetical protein
MKKILLTSLLSAGAMGAYAQGVLSFTDYDFGTITTHIWSPSSTAGQASVPLSGNTSSDTPTGTTTYTGSVLIGGSATGSGSTAYANGNNFTVQLEALGGATTAVPLTSLLPVTQYTTHMNTVNNAGTGQFAGNWTPPTQNNDPGIPGAGGTAPTADIAVAAWYNGGGTITSLAAAQSAVGGVWGESPEVVNFALTAPSSITGKPEGFLNDQSTVSFRMTTTSIPEPSSIALGVMAAGAFIARRRKS